MYEGKLTANSLAKGNELPYRELGAFDAPDHGPLPVVFDGSGYYVGEILRRGKRDETIVSALHRKRSAVIKVDGSLDGSNVFGRLVRIGQVIDKQARLEKRILKNLEVCVG